MSGEYTVTLPWPGRKLNPNGRLHPLALAKAKRAYKSDAVILCKFAKVPRGTAKVHVVFHPNKRGPMPDRDNCIASFKAGQDGIALALGVDDRNLDVTHEVSTARDNCVRVRITMIEALIPMKGEIS